MAAPLLWEGIADDCVALIACHLAPSYGTSDLGDAQVGALESMRAAHLLRSVGAAHWLALNRACSSTGRPWRAALCHNRKWYDQAGACQRVLEIEDAAEDWPLAVLRLRASALHPESSARKLSHATPISKSTLRAAFRSVAKEVHPDRSAEVGSLATRAMTVLNEAYRLSLLHFAEREAPAVIRLDALGLEHHAA